MIIPIYSSSYHSKHQKRKAKSPSTRFQTIPRKKTNNKRQHGSKEIVTSLRAMSANFSPTRRLNRGGGDRGKQSTAIRIGLRRGRGPNPHGGICCWGQSRASLLGKRTWFPCGYRQSQSSHLWQCGRHCGYPRWRHRGHSRSHTPSISSYCHVRNLYPLKSSGMVAHRH